MKHIDKQLTGKSNLGDQRVTDFVRELERNGPPVTPAHAFDIAEVVIPRWRDAIYEAELEGRSNPFNTDILRIVHTMFMTELATCARRSLFTNYCPRHDQVTLGPVDALGIPKYYILKFDR